MNVFCPFPSPLDCAKAIWGDSRRYNKQIIECRRIIAAIEGAKVWRNHPVCLMYKEHKEWLYNYMMCFAFHREYKKGNDFAFKYCCYFSEKADAATPPFLTEEFCDQHKRRLFTKSPDKYPQFAKYGTSEENWYFIDGELLKYVNGKMI